VKARVGYLRSERLDASAAYPRFLNIVSLALLLDARGLARTRIRRAVESRRADDQEVGRLGRRTDRAGGRSERATWGIVG
jgi:hypothetical protein